MRHDPRPRAATLMVIVALSGVALSIGLGAAAEESGSVRRGMRIVHEWCGICHSIEGKETDPNRAPTFASIAARPGRTERYFARFLEQDHFPMTTYRLFDHEKSDVVTLLLWLQREDSDPRR